VAPSGQNRWIVGCPGKGDPRHENGWLIGDIVSATHAEAPSPLCVLSATNQNIPVSVRLIVRADREHFSLTDENSNASSIDDLVLRFGKINIESLSRREKAERGLRSRIAILAATKRAKLPQSSETRPDVLELMSLAASFIPACETE
jgi:hypothetical protein